MMPAISINALPSLPPFQFLPEADLNFGAVLEAVPAQVSQAPAQIECALPDQTLLSFLGMNPVKAQPIAPESAVVEDETLHDEAAIPETPFSREGGSPAPIIDSFGLGTGLPPSRENGEGLGAAVPPEFPNGRASTSFGLGITGSPEVSDTPLPQPFGLSLSKPCPSFDLGEKDSTSTGSVRTELGIMPLSITPSGLSEVKEPSPTQPIIATPPTDPLRFVVERQLDLARDSRWLDALARDIVAVAETPDRLSFRLHPPQLGRLDVDLSSSDSGLSLRMNASSEAATQIIAAAQPRLIDELKNQGVRVAEAQVSTSSGGQSQGQGQQQQRDADQMIEFVRQRIERSNEANLTRPTGRFA